MRSCAEAPLPNCFVLERKHKSSKEHMKDRLNPAGWERSVLEEMLLDQIYNLNEVRPHGVLRPHAPGKAVLEELQETLGENEPALEIAAEFRATTGETYFTHDVVYARGPLGLCVGQVKRFVLMPDRRKLAQLGLWDQISWNADTRIGVYGVGADSRLVPCGDLRAAAIYSSSGSRRTTLWPTHV